MSRTNRAFYTTVANAISNYVGLGMSLLSIPVLLEYLGKEDYGLFLTVLSFNGFFSLGTLNILGGTRILIAIANGDNDEKEQEINKIFSNGLFLSLMLGLLLVAIMIAYFIVKSFFENVHFIDPKYEILFALLLVQVLINVIGGNFSNLFEALQDGYIQQLYYGTRRVLGTCLMMVAAIYTGEVVYVMITTVLLVALEYVFIALHAIKRYKRFLNPSISLIDKNQLIRQLTTGSKSFLYEIASLIKVSGIIWAISLKLGNEFVPDFTITRSIIFSVLAIFLSFSRSLQPAYGEAFKCKDEGWIKSSITSLIKSNLFLPFILIFILYPAVNDILFVWGSFDINFSKSLFLIVALYAYFNYVNQSLLLILNGVNRQKTNMILYLIDAFLSFIIGFILLDIYADIRYLIFVSAIISVCLLPIHLKGISKNVTSMNGILDLSFYKKYFVFLIMISGFFLMYIYIKGSGLSYISIFTILYLIIMLVLMGVLLKKLRMFDHCINFNLWKLNYKFYI